MRVISGLYKGRRFEVPHSFKARPTTDFAKENIFNVLNNLIDFTDGVHALDLFSGTGSISIELVSRGCEQVTSIEKEREHYAFIMKVKGQVGAANWHPVHADVFKYLAKCGQQFDFIFADPPYELPEIETIPSLIFKQNLLKEKGILVLEHGKKNKFDSLPFFHQHRTYGSVNFSIFIRQETVGL